MSDPSLISTSYPIGVLSLPLRSLNVGEKRISKYASSTVVVPASSGISLNSK